MLVSLLVKLSVGNYVGSSVSIVVGINVCVCVGMTSKCASNGATSLQCQPPNHEYMHTHACVMASNVAPNWATILPAKS